MSIVDVGVGFELDGVDAQLERVSRTESVFDLETVLVGEKVGVPAVDQGLVDAVVLPIVAPTPNEVATDGQGIDSTLAPILINKNTELMRL